MWGLRIAVLPSGCLKRKRALALPELLPHTERFQSWLGHIPRLRVQSLVGACMEALTAVSLSCLLPSAQGHHGSARPSAWPACLRDVMQEWTSL